MTQDSLGSSGEMPSPDGVLAYVVGVPAGVAILLGATVVLFRAMAYLNDLLQGVPYYLRLFSRLLVVAVVVGVGLYSLIRVVDWLRS